MKDIYKSMTIYLKRYWIWLVLVPLLSLVFILGSYVGRVELEVRNLGEVIVDMEFALSEYDLRGPYRQALIDEGIDEGGEYGLSQLSEKLHAYIKDRGLDPDLLKGYSQVFEDLAREEDLDLSSLSDEGFDYELAQSRAELESESQAQETEVFYHRIWTYLNFRSMYFEEGEPVINMEGAEVLDENDLYFLAILLALVLFGLEKLTPYYEFTLTYPWAPSRSYWARIILGLAILLLTWALASLLRYGYLASSALAGILVLGQDYQGLVLSGLDLLGVYLMASAAGTLAGNFLGQGLITIFFLEGPRVLGNCLNIILDLAGTGVEVDFYGWAQGLPDFLRGLFMTLYSTKTYLDPHGPVAWGRGLGLVLIILVLLLIGQVASARPRAERVGLMVLSPGLSRLVQALTTLVAACLLATFLFFNFKAASLLPLLLFGLVLLILGLLINRVFKLRIGI